MCIKCTGSKKLRTRFPELMSYLLSLVFASCRFHERSAILSWIVRIKSCVCNYRPMRRSSDVVEFGLQQPTDSQQHVSLYVVVLVAQWAKSLHDLHLMLYLQHIVVISAWCWQYEIVIVYIRCLKLGWIRGHRSKKHASVSFSGPHSLP